MEEAENQLSVGEVRLPVEIVRELAPALQALGHTMPEAARIVPRVNLDIPVSELGMQLGQLLRQQGIYRMGEGRGLVTVCGSSSRIVPMTSPRMCSWVEHTVVTYKPQKNYDRAITMGKDLASKIMEADRFLEQLHQLNGVAPVRMPVRRGPRDVELLPVGYDAATGVYCSASLDYDLHMSLDDARATFEWLLNEFAFEGVRGAIWSTRSALVQVAAILGTYCRYLWEPGTTKPMMIWSANQPGAGKSLLAYMTLAHVYGSPGNSAIPPKEEEMVKVLDATAQSRSPYLWFDDSPPALYSKALNKFILAAKHEGRILGTPYTFEEPAVTQVLLTGNGLIIERDLERRAMICELFEAGEIEDREFPLEITPEFLRTDAVRSRLLAACWAVVREWTANECHQSSKRKNSFEAWSGDIAGMLACLGVQADVLGKPELAQGGDVESDQFRELLMALAHDVDEEDTTEFLTIDEIIDKARELELLPELMGSAGGKPVTDDRRRKLGRRLEKWRGRKLVDPRGRRFEFGQRRTSERRGIEIRFLGA